jgi:hypothetical protein
MSLDVSAQRIRLALDLFATGEALMRQQLRRRHPEWTETELRGELLKWLRERPGAESGDAVGSPPNRLA